jgi:hypothetical protein
MKKYIKILAIAISCIGLTSAAFAQGQINFFTFNSTTSLGQVFSTAGVPAGGTYVGQLYGGLTSDRTTFTAVGTPSAFASNSGYINSGIVNVAGTFGGQTFFYELRVWDSALASSLETQATGRGGISPNVASLVLGGTPNGGGTPVPVSNANGFNTFTLAPVPEPSTIALGILGAGSLLFLRRKK